MPQDSWNLMFGTKHKTLTYRGSVVDMHAPQEYAGQVVPGYGKQPSTFKGKIAKKRSRPQPRASKRVSEDLLPLQSLGYGVR